MDDNKRVKEEISEIEKNIAGKAISEQEERIEAQIRRMRLLVIMGLALSNCFIFAWVLSALRLDLTALTHDAIYIKSSSFMLLSGCCIAFVIAFTIICYSQIRRMKLDIKDIIRQATDDTYSEIIARNDELIRVNKTLLEERKANNERITMKQKYLSQLSHEMRNPLTAIIYTINKAEKTEDIAELKAHIEKISESSKHMLNVLNDTLEMAKIQSGEVTLVHTVFAVKDILSNVENMFCASAENKQIALEFELSPTIPEYLYGDKLKVTQVLINLISNAMKFTEAGGKITVTAESYDSSNENITLKFTVKDTGIGIAPDKLEMIFEDYKQIESKQEKVQNGTGLGLAIARKIALLMHGDLRVRSTLGKGSEFEFTALFAVADQSRIQNESRKTLKDFDLSDKTVLVVEDVEINAQMIGLLFETAGAKVIYAENGGAALEVWNKEHSSINLIMMDIYMPVMNGIKAARMIRSSHKRNAQKVPIIALSGSTFDETETQSCCGAGMNDYLLKPATESSVVNIIMKYLDV